MGMLSLDTIFDRGSAIKDAQKRTWVNLKVKSKFNIPLENTQKLLEKFVNTNIVLIILNVDLVSSTKLSMDLPLKRLVPIVQTYTQEMSFIIEAYGGYVFKYIGDAILAFFFTTKDDLYLPCNNAINYGYSMIKVIEEGINSILEENGYPELYIRVGIDVGENAVVRYGLMTDGYRINKEKNVKEDCHEKNHNNINNKEILLKKQHLDILGYTINTASKMLSFAKPNQIIIGEAVYRILNNDKKKDFKKIHINNESWNYLDNSTGNIYGLYCHLMKNS